MNVDRHSFWIVEEPLSTSPSTTNHSDSTRRSGLGSSGNFAALGSGLGQDQTRLTVHSVHDIFSRPPSRPPSDSTVLVSQTPSDANVALNVASTPGSSPLRSLARPTTSIKLAELSSDPSDESSANLIDRLKRNSYYNLNTDSNSTATAANLYSNSTQRGTQTSYSTQRSLRQLQYSDERERDGAVFKINRRLLKFVGVSLGKGGSAEVTKVRTLTEDEHRCYEVHVCAGVVGDDKVVVDDIQESTNIGESYTATSDIYIRNEDGTLVKPLRDLPPNTFYAVKAIFPKSAYEFDLYFREVDILWALRGEENVIQLIDHDSWRGGSADERGGPSADHDANGHKNYHYASPGDGRHKFAGGNDLLVVGAGDGLNAGRGGNQNAGSRIGMSPFIFLLMELADKGDLGGYLDETRERDRVVEKSQKEMQREARYNKVRVGPVGESESGLLISLEEFDRRCRRKRDLFKQVCKGVMALHRRNIIHADLKPANFLVTTTSSRKGHADESGDEVEIVVKVADLGLAMALEDGASHVMRHALVGTMHYMAPETIYHYKNQQELSGYDDNVGTDDGTDDIVGNHNDFNSIVEDGLREDINDGPLRDYDEKEKHLLERHSQDKKDLQSTLDFCQGRTHYQSDVWALGIILYQMIYGTTPYRHLQRLGPWVWTVMVDEKIRPQYHAGLVAARSGGGRVVNISQEFERLIRVCEGCLRHDLKKRWTLDRVMEELERDLSVRQQGGESRGIREQQHQRQADSECSKLKLNYYNLPAESLTRLIKGRGTLGFSTTAPDKSDITALLRLYQGDHVGEESLKEKFRRVKAEDYIPLHFLDETSSESDESADGPDEEDSEDYNINSLKAGSSKEGVAATVPLLGKTRGAPVKELGRGRGESSDSKFGKRGREKSREKRRAREERKNKKRETSKRRETCWWKCTRWNFCVASCACCRVKGGRDSNLNYYSMSPEAAVTPAAGDIKAAAAQAAAYRRAKKCRQCFRKHRMWLVPLIWFFIIALAVLWWFAFFYFVVYKIFVKQNELASLEARALDLTNELRNHCGWVQRKDVLLNLGEASYVGPERSSTSRPERASTWESQDLGKEREFEDWISALISDFEKADWDGFLKTESIANFPETLATKYPTKYLNVPDRDSGTTLLMATAYCGYAKSVQNLLNAAVTGPLPAEKDNSKQGGNAVTSTKKTINAEANTAMNGPAADRSTHAASISAATTGGKNYLANAKITDHNDYDALALAIYADNPNTSIALIQASTPFVVVSNSNLNSNGNSNEPIVMTTRVDIGDDFSDSYPGLRYRQWPPIFYFDNLRFNSYITGPASYLVLAIWNANVNIVEALINQTKMNAIARVNQAKSTTALISENSNTKKNMERSEKLAVERLVSASVGPGYLWTPELSVCYATWPMAGREDSGFARYGKKALSEIMDFLLNPLKNENMYKEKYTNSTSEIIDPGTNSSGSGSGEVYHGIVQPFPNNPPYSTTKYVNLVNNPYDKQNNSTNNLDNNEFEVYIVNQASAQAVDVRPIHIYAQSAFQPALIQKLLDAGSEINPIGGLTHRITPLDTALFQTRTSCGIAVQGDAFSLLQDQGDTRWTQENLEIVKKTHGGILEFMREGAKLNTNSRNTNSPNTINDNHSHSMDVNGTIDVLVANGAWHCAARSCGPSKKYMQFRSAMEQWKQDVENVYRDENRPSGSEGGGVARANFDYCRKLGKEILQFFKWD